MPKILENLKKSNSDKRIKIRYRKLPSGKYSLYLDLWHNNKRIYDFLKIYIRGNRNSRIEDKNKLKLALSIRDQKELKLFENETGFNLTNKETKLNLVEYLKNIAETEEKSKILKKGAYKYLRDFTNGSIKVMGVDKKFCLSFKKYLKQNLAPRSVNLYFIFFKSALKRLVEDAVIKKNPASNIKREKVTSKREFLTEKELKLLKSTECDDEEVKNGFLFSCYTGLRLSDVRALRFSQIKGDYLVYRQQKTKSSERVKLSNNALKIIKEQNKTHKKVFNLPSAPTIKRKLVSWLKAAGIDKHITFHCARHTFATMCLTYDIDIYTVSKLLGHKDIKTTQIYAKLIDKKKDEAVDKLPEI